MEIGQPTLCCRHSRWRASSRTASWISSQSWLDPPRNGQTERRSPVTDHSIRWEPGCQHTRRLRQHLTWGRAVAFGLDRSCEAPLSIDAGTEIGRTRPFMQCPRRERCVAPPQAKCVHPYVGAYADSPAHAGWDRPLRLPKLRGFPGGPPSRMLGASWKVLRAALCERENRQ